MFFNKNSKTDVDQFNFVKIASLLIHTAKIDEKYTQEEEKIIKKTLLDLGANPNHLENIITQAQQNEENSNQILDYTREIKNLEDLEKIKILKSLWRIIYSNKDADIYETNLMRRLSGLLYIDNKTMGDIKEQIKKENME